MNPYLIEGPACISFSGGRTSGYMLRKIVDAYGWTLSHDMECGLLNAPASAERLSPGRIG